MNAVMVDNRRVDLGFHPRPWQDEVLRSLKRFSVAVVHRRGGKTVMTVLKLVDAALRCAKERGRFAYIAPELKQAKGVAWDYIRAYASKITGTRINEGELWVEFPNGARIRIYGADSPDSLRGLYFDGVVLDEVAQMRANVWGEIILPALADRGGWAMFIGTPKGINLFSELYFKGQSNPDWFARSYSVDMTGALSPEELATMRVNMSEQQWRQEMLCDFSASGDDTLISLDLINAAMGRHLRPDQYSFAPKVLGVDVARQGADRSVIQPRQGLAAFQPTILKIADTQQVADIVAEHCNTWQPDAVFVDGSGGYGAGVIDRLRRLGYSPIEIQFGGSPSNDRFANKRTEMWWRMREWLREGGCVPNMSEYRIDLTGPRYDFANAAGRMSLESKEKMAARGIISPDVGDSLALTLAAHVAPRSDLRNPIAARSNVIRDYDPYARE